MQLHTRASAITFPCLGRRCVCACVCVRERDRMRQADRQKSYCLAEKSHCLAPRRRSRFRLKTHSLQHTQCKQRTHARTHARARARAHTQITLPDGSAFKIVWAPVAPISTSTCCVCVCARARARARGILDAVAPISTSTYAAPLHVTPPSCVRRLALPASCNTNWVKGGIFCVGDRYKGVTHSSWSTTVGRLTWKMIMHTRMIYSRYPPHTAKPHLH
jgi:hypothetical protein